VLVTAWHVLNDIGAAVPDAPVRVDPLAGGAAFDAQVARLDHVHDLAVITAGTALPTTVGGLILTDQVPLRTPVSVTGYARVPHADEVRFLDAPGEWAGRATREDSVLLGRLTATAIMLGMSGAPVIRDSDKTVAGVVSGRYNSADGWLAGTAWIARTEDLLPLLDGVAEIPVQRAPLAGPVDLVLTVTADLVRLTGPGTDVSDGHAGVRPGLVEAMHEVRRGRARAGLSARTPTETGARPEELSLTRAGRLLGESYLPGPVAQELERQLKAADRAHQPVRLGLEVPLDLAGLPWEALPSPDGRGPLALHPLVSMYRKAEAGAARVLPGPLRIVVAISSPSSGGGPLLDYERELRNVLAAVRVARQDAAAAG
jgi:hypothetical protein